VITAGATIARHGRHGPRARPDPPIGVFDVRVMACREWAQLWVICASAELHQLPAGPVVYGLGGITGLFASAAG